MQAARERVWDTDWCEPGTTATSATAVSVAQCSRFIVKIPLVIVTLPLRPWTHRQGVFLASFMFSNLFVFKFVPSFGPACVSPHVVQRLTSHLRSICSSRQAQEIGTSGKVSVDGCPTLKLHRRRFSSPADSLLHVVLLGNTICRTRRTLCIRGNSVL
jgi:hypothetical protein